MNKETVIISMASYPGRIDDVCRVWESILNQECVEKCHCVLSLEIPEFPNRENDLPEDLKNLIESKKIEVIWHPTHIRSHKKFMSPLSKYPDNPLLVVDDDIVRSEGWLKRFFEMHEKYPNDIIAGSISYWWDQDGIIHRFDDTKGVRCGGFSNVPNLIYNTAKPSSGAGTFYPAHTFTDRRFFDENLFMSLSPTSDETWAYCFNVIEDRTIRMLDEVFDPSLNTIKESQKDPNALYKFNGLTGYQNISNSLFEAFPEFKEKLIERSRRIIVSLTSFKERLKYVPVTIGSILNGTLQPSKIVLTLDRKDIEFIPDELQTMIDDGTIELLVSDYLIKPHTKYFLTMQKYRNYAVVTIDDDIEYTPDLLESLYNVYMLHPNCICARRCHRIKWSESDTVLPYGSWQWQCKDYKEPRFDLFATGVGGVLYPPDILNINDNMIPEIRECLNADDIYLKWLELNKKIKTIWVSNKNLSGLGNIGGTQEMALWKSNCRLNQNDVYLEQFRLPHIPEPQKTQVRKEPHTRHVVQPDMAECTGNFDSPVAVFTCCFNGETPIKHVIKNAKFYCFTTEYRRIDGWQTIVVNNFKKDIEWGKRYIQMHPNRFLPDYDHIIYIHPQFPVPKNINLNFKESLAMYEGENIYEFVDRMNYKHNILKTLKQNHVNQLCKCTNDNLVIYNFRNSNTEKVLSEIWGVYNGYDRSLSFATCLPKYREYVRIIKS